MIDRLGNPEPFFAEGTALGERAQLGMAPARVQARESTAGRLDLTEALVSAAPHRGTPRSASRQSIA